MFIQTEETPNPQSLKFIPDGIIIVEKGSLEIKNKVDAKEKSPLALELFAIEGVHSIFLGHDFITVTKLPEIDWKHIKTEIMACIVDFFVAGKQAVKDSAKADDSSVNEDDNEIVKQIKELLEVKVRPAVAMDGGDVIYRGFEDGVVKLELKGSCSGCPSSTITLKHGIENMFKHYIPEVESVEQVFEE
jgi:Fe-S cluster biogenesis protein NfuA